jgi:hypothetical protein
MCIVNRVLTDRTLLVNVFHEFGQNLWKSVMVKKKIYVESLTDLHVLSAAEYVNEQHVGDGGKNLGILMDLQNF